MNPKNAWFTNEPMSLTDFCFKVSLEKKWCSRLSSNSAVNYYLWSIQSLKLWYICNNLWVIQSMYIVYCIANVFAGKSTSYYNEPGRLRSLAYSCSFVHLESAIVSNQLRLDLNSSLINFIEVIKSLKQWKLFLFVSFEVCAWFFMSQNPIQLRI